MRGEKTSLARRTGRGRLSVELRDLESVPFSRSPTGKIAKPLRSQILASGPEPGAVDVRGGSFFDFLLEGFISSKLF